MLAHTDHGVFIKAYLTELTRTYSGVGGISTHDVHDADVFEWIDKFSVKLSSSDSSPQVIQKLIEATPGEVYDILASSRSSEEVTQRMEQAVLPLQRCS